MSQRSVILLGDDEPALLAYFAASPDHTIWMRIAWRDKQARFAALIREDRIVSLAAHGDNGVIQVHASDATASLAEVVQLCRRQELLVIGVAGDPEQVASAIAALGLGDRPIAYGARETIMSCNLEELVAPELMSRPEVVIRRSRIEDLPRLIEWRLQYFQEVHGMAPEDSLVDEVRRDHDQGRMWVFEDGGEIGSTLCFSAVFPDLVQIEYSYSPPEIRVKRYGRSAVAGALLAVRGLGVRRAVFNTAESNIAVHVATKALGFRVVGSYHVVVFAQS